MVSSAEDACKPVVHHQPAHGCCQHAAAQWRGAPRALAVPPWPTNGCSWLLAACSSSTRLLHPGCAGLCETHFDLVKAHFGEAMQDAGASQVRLVACLPARLREGRMPAAAGRLLLLLLLHAWCGPLAAAALPCPALCRRASPTHLVWCPPILHLSFSTKELNTCPPSPPRPTHLQRLIDMALGVVETTRRIMFPAGGAHEQAVAELEAAKAAAKTGSRPAEY